MVNESLIELIQENNPEALMADGFDDSIIGWDSNDGRVIYDIEKMILNILFNNKDMTYEEAREYIDFNIIGAYVGKFTPLYLENGNV